MWTKGTGVAMNRKRFLCRLRYIAYLSLLLLIVFPHILIEYLPDVEQWAAKMDPGKCACLIFKSLSV